MYSGKQEGDSEGHRDLCYCKQQLCIAKAEEVSTNLWKEGNKELLERKFKVSVEECISITYLTYKKNLSTINFILSCAFILSLSCGCRPPSWITV